MREAGKEKGRLEKKIKQLSEEKNIKLEELDQLRNDTNNMKNKLKEVNIVLSEKEQELNSMMTDLEQSKMECKEKEDHHDANGVT